MKKDREGRLRVVPLSLSSFAAHFGRAVFRYPLQLVLDFFKRAFFQTADLRLRDADFVGDLRLRPSVVKAQREDAPLALAELADGLRDGDFVQPLIVGDNSRALQLAEKLRQQGCWVTAIRPPTVPAGTARLRLTLTAAHEMQDIDSLLEVLHDNG